MHLVNLYFLNFSSFYDRLNDVGRLVFYIVLLLFFILIVLIIMAILQNNTVETLKQKRIQALKEDERKLEEIKKSTNKIDIPIDENNEKTRDLKKIVDQIKQVTSDVKQDLTDMYEDEQEKTAVISYDELIKGSKLNTNITMPKEEINKAREIDSNEAFLRNLKEFRKNL